MALGGPDAAVGKLDDSRAEIFKALPENRLGTAVPTLARSLLTVPLDEVGLSKTRGFPFPGQTAVVASRTLNIRRSGTVTPVAGRSRRRNNDIRYRKQQEESGRGEKDGL